MLTNGKYTFKAKASCKAEVDQKYLNFSHFLYLHSSGTQGLRVLPVYKVKATGYLRAKWVKQIDSGEDVNLTFF